MHNYAAGTRLERRCVALLAQRDYYVVRAGGSHGIADLIALTPCCGAVVMVQCKTTHRDHEGWNALYDVARAYGATPLFATWNDTRRSVVWHRITGRHEPRSHTWPADTFRSVVQTEGGHSHGITNVVALHVPARASEPHP